MTTYHVFVRDWWKDNPDWPNGLEPCPGEKETLETGIESETAARALAQEYNRNHPKGRYSRKAEYESE